MKILIKYISIFLLLISLFACSKDETNGTDIKLLVKNVYDYHHNLVAHYIYDDENKLIKREFTNPTTNTSSDLLFYYENDLISRVDYVSYDFPQSSHEKYYHYNTHNQIDKIETFKGNQLISTFLIDYSNDGKIISFHAPGQPPYVSYVYDNKGNIIKTINKLIDPDTGHESVQICGFVYDTHKKPSFGLNYLIGIDLLPWRGSTSTWEQSISPNNLLYETCSGNKYALTFNEYAYPATITTTWKDIVTDEPMTIRIEYEKE